MDSFIQDSSTSILPPVSVSPISTLCSSFSTTNDVPTINSHNPPRNNHNLHEATLKKKQERWARRDEKKAKSKEGIWENCLYYLPQKKRYCNQKRSNNTKYCISHDPSSFTTTASIPSSTHPSEEPETNSSTVDQRGLSFVSTNGTTMITTATNNRKRIRCPIDPSHDIFEDDVHRHQYRCQFRKQMNLLQEQPYYSKYINSGTCSRKDKEEITVFRTAVGIINTFAKEPSSTIDKDDGDGNETEDILPNDETINSTTDEETTTTNDTFSGGIIGGAPYGVMDLENLQRKVTVKKKDEPTSNNTETKHNNKGYVQRLLRDSNVNFHMLICRIREWVLNHLVSSSTISWTNQLLSTKEGTRILDSIRDTGGSIGKFGILRHELQQVSIIANMIYYDLLPAYRNQLDNDGIQLLETPILHPQRISIVERPLFIEYGAGTGQLSRTLQDLLHHTADILLIDRATIRSKADKLIKLDDVNRDNNNEDNSLVNNKSSSCSPSSVLCKRYRVDIVHFDIEGIEEIWNHGSWRFISIPQNISPTSSSSSSSSLSSLSTSSVLLRKSVLPVISIGKHLCGGATDITLRSLVRTFASRNGKTQEANVAYLAGDCDSFNPNSARKSFSSTTTTTSSTHESSVSSNTATDIPSTTTTPAYLHGLAIATCCHHMCTWESYVGKYYWRNILQSTPSEFETIRVLSGWAIIGKKPSYIIEKESSKIGSTTLTDTTINQTNTVAVNNTDDNLCPCCKQSLSNQIDDISSCSLPHLPVTLTRLYPELRMNNEEWVQNSISYYDRIAIGRACKRLIDEGRAYFLRRAFRYYKPVIPLTPKGFTVPHDTSSPFKGDNISPISGDTVGGESSVDTSESIEQNPLSLNHDNRSYTLDVRLAHYCEPSISPENCLLLAVARYAG